ncbi:leucine-rich repeat and immunoglobulin-like domain-containing nogo receptor-interacting protein 3 [Oncorhynchus keta]|uniref:leucine-rich repeat and immunoglobulin-like domain-containing nogo receptor-interacting protein 3 n=1 Tax=Oncorhynchus keta TaxID=8018 RepID=UPI00227A6A8B|nr:leucine-rich repeat and immunoglobulin-like domain-containing nogo receptor-interacting protein 3 [Oncorhynchus keta]
MALVFLLLFLPLSHHSNAMTGCHSDRDKDHRPRVNCTATNLSDVPASIDTTTKVLIFTQNQFSSLTWSSYSHFPELYEIDLSHNAVPEVPLSPGPILPTLGVLRLVGNRIRTLPPHSFRATPGLLELYLDQNILETLDDLSFSGLRLLQVSTPLN